MAKEHVLDTPYQFIPYDVISIISVLSPSRPLLSILPGDSESSRTPL